MLRGFNYLSVKARRNRSSSFCTTAFLRFQFFWKFGVCSRGPYRTWRLGGWIPFKAMFSGVQTTANRFLSVQTMVLHILDAMAVRIWAVIRYCAFFGGSSDQSPAKMSAKARKLRGGRYLTLGRYISATTGPIGLRFSGNVAKHL